jgi:hypothetical protein
MIATYAKVSAMTWLLAFAIGLLGVGHAAEVPVSVALLDIDSGTTSPQGNYRWMNVSDQVYAVTYRDDYDYTQASVTADFFTNAATLHAHSRRRISTPTSPISSSSSAIPARRRTSASA